MIYSSKNTQESECLPALSNVQVPAGLFIIMYYIQPHSTAQCSGHISMRALAQFEAVLVTDGSDGDILASCMRSGL